jgi:hypothetical protein
MSRTSGMVVLMVSVVVAVVLAYGLRFAGPPTDTRTTADGGTAVVVDPVPTDVRPARISRGSIESGGMSFDVSISSIPLNKVLRTDLSPADIPPLVNPSIVSASSSESPAGEDQVVGVVVDGVPRAYPLSVLNYHWVVNDTIDGRAVAVFWDPIAGAIAAYQASAEGRRAEFGAAGLLYRGNGLFYDKQTTSLFLPLQGCFVTGALAGRRLQFLPSWRQEWGTWLERWPGSRVLSSDTGYERPYERDPYAAVQVAEGQTIDYFASNAMLIEPTGTDPEQRLRPKERVLGFVTPAGKSYCSSLDGVPRGESEPSLAIDGAHIVPLPDGGARAVLSGGVWPQQAICFYFAWYGAYPETSVSSSSRGVDVDG